LMRWLGLRHVTARTAAHASLLSIHDVKNQPDARTPAGSRFQSPRRGAGLYARGIAESNSLLRIFGMPDQRSIHMRLLMIVLPGRRSLDATSHLAGTPSHKVLGCFGNLSLTVTEGNGMFQLVN
jgi:hypothetical protein